MRVKRADILLIAALLLLGAGLFLLRALTREAGGEVVVTVNGVETARYPLNENREVRLENADGGWNLLVIDDGTADVTEASCPDKICVNAHAVRHTGESIICLPNRTVISIEGGKPSGVDIG